MLLQGFPVAAVSDLVKRTSNRAMADLAGNMVAVPVLLVLLTAAVASVDRRGVDVAPAGARQAEPREVEASDMEAALFALGLLAKAGREKPDEAPVQKRIKF